MDTATAIILIAASYLVGSTPFGLLTVRLIKGVDIRTVGSGNIGATNVGRLLGRKGFVGVFILDFCKGFGPVMGAGWYAGRCGYASAGPSPWVVACGLGAILGHVFPVYLRFKGGKAVATSTGVFAALAPWATLIGLAAFLVVFGVFRYVSLASMTAAVAALAGVLFTTRDPFGEGKVLSIMAAVISTLIVIRHKENIKRLLKGEENPFGKTRGPAAEEVEEQGGAGDSDQ